MRILYVITTLDVGGAEKHLLWLCQGMIGRGHSCDVVYLKGEGRLVPEFERIGCRVEKVAFESPRDLVRAVRDLAARFAAGDSPRYDVVHSHLLKADALTAIAARLTAPAVLVQSKHNEEQVLKKRAVALIHGFLTRAVDRVIALSDYVLEYVATTGRVPRSKLQRIYYGIDAARFEGGDRAATRRALGIADSTHVALCVARFHPQKDHPTLFRAVDRLRNEGRDVLLLLAGGDPFYGFRKDLEQRVEALKLSDHVRFLGIRDDVADLLAACDVFALPSLYEGLGLVYLEAMAAGRPVLATRSTAIPEVVEHGVTGELIEIGDDGALAAAWGRLAGDPARGRAMGEAGRRRVAQLFTLPRMIDEILTVYRAAGAR
jgi:glycosyltransferase involved in cell wall biosynthesis